MAEWLTCGKRLCAGLRACCEWWGWWVLGGLQSRPLLCTASVAHAGPVCRRLTCGGVHARLPRTRFVDGLQATAGGFIDYARAEPGSVQGCRAVVGAVRGQEQQHVTGAAPKRAMRVQPDSPVACARIAYPPCFLHRPPPNKLACPVVGALCRVEQATIHPCGIN